MPCRGKKGQVDMLQQKNEARISAAARLPVSNRDRRATRRMPINRELEMTVITEDSTPAHRVRVRALDISRTGMGVVTRVALRPGIRAVLPLARQDGRRALVGVEVMHATAAGDGIDAQGCAAGLRFFKLSEAVARRSRL